MLRNTISYLCIPMLYVCCCEIGDSLLRINPVTVAHKELSM